MGFDKVKIRQICFLVLYIAAVVLLLIYSDLLFQGLGLGLKILMPFLVGGAIAFILNIPMNFIEKRIFGKWNGKLARALKRPICLILSIIFVLAIMTLVVCAVVPQLRDTIVILGNKIPPFIEDIVVWLKSLTVDYPELTNVIGQLENYEFDWNKLTANIGGFLTNGVGNVLTSTISFAGSILSGIANTFIAIVFAIYILVQKENLQNQAIRCVDAYTKDKTNARIKDICSRLHTNFTNFICGQCLEAVILGLLFVIFMSIFQMPYAVMIGTLIAFTALIPIVGAFIGCGVGVFMLLIENPMQAVWFLVLFLILQQLEGNLIYPRVVGNSVGLPSIWVLASVTIGGSMFGIGGMLVFIPLMSTLYSLLRDDVNQRNGQATGRRRGRNASRAQQVQQGKAGDVKAQQVKPTKTQETNAKQAKEQKAKKQLPKQQPEQQNQEKPVGQQPAGQQSKEQPAKQQPAKEQEPKAKQPRAQKNKKQSQNTPAEKVDSSTEDLIARLVAEGEEKVRNELGEDPTKTAEAPKPKKKKRYYYNNNKKK